jgi:triosephosphate isomerase (TIM)
MRTKLVVGNWKMNMTAPEAAAAVQTYVNHVDAKSSVDVVVCPPYTSIHRVRELLANTHIKVGAQDVFWLDCGAFTGKVSAPMLYEAGVTHCIIGHSETRGRFGKLEIPDSRVSYFAESDETVNLKLRALLFHSITPILCVGETAAERDAGRTDEVIRTQLSAALEGVDPAELYFFVVAYEPVWAIGTGNTCDAAEAERVIAMIRSALGDLLDKDVAQDVRILYGGSVKASSAAELFRQPNIDGGLVGGASLDPGEFSRIVMCA